MVEELKKKEESTAVEEKKAEKTEESPPVGNKDNRALREEAERLSQSGHLHEAIISYQDYLRIEPNDSIALIKLADILFKKASSMQQSKNMKKC